MPNTLSRGLSALALGSFATLGLVGTAQAAPGNCPSATHYTSTGCVTDTVSATTAHPGDTIVVTGGGFGSGSIVMVTICGKSAGTLTADSLGTASGSVTVPTSSRFGSCQIVLSGTGGNGAAHVVTFPLRVTGAGKTLPFTGFEFGEASLLGAGMLGAGNLAVVVGRKRKDVLHAA